MMTNNIFIMLLLFYAFILNSSCYAEVNANSNKLTIELTPKINKSAILNLIQLKKNLNPSKKLLEKYKKSIIENISITRKLV